MSESTALGLRVDLLRTHPTVLMGGTVLENQYHAALHELLAGLV